MSRAGQRGALLIASILLIVLAGVIGAQVLRGVSLGREGMSLDMMQVRARYAVVSGIAWAERYIRAYGNCFESPLTKRVFGGGHGHFELELDCRAHPAENGRFVVRVFAASGTPESPDYAQAKRSVSLSAVPYGPHGEVASRFGY